MSTYTNQAIKKAGRPRKELIVAELVEKIDSASGLVFTDYKGLTHVQLENLKKELKKLDATIFIAKNSLLKISLGKSKNYADFKDNEGLNLPTATLFIKSDMIEPLKKLQKVIKELSLPKIKFGILEGNLTDGAGVLKIASLPNRETLLAQFVGMLNSPIQGLVVTLNGNIQKFVMTLDAVAKAKPAVPQGDALQNQTASEQPVASSQEPVAEPAQTETPAEQPTSEPVEEPVEAKVEPTAEEKPEETQAENDNNSATSN